MNVDENPVTPATYRVTGIPTLNVYQNGEVVRQIVGAKPKAALLNELSEFIGRDPSSRATPALPVGGAGLDARRVDNPGPACVCLSRGTSVGRPSAGRRRRTSTVTRLPPDGDRPGGRGDQGPAGPARAWSWPATAPPTPSTTASTGPCARFQQQRGLTVDGIVGPTTYRVLDEARWRLGDRLLTFTPAPALRRRRGRAAAAAARPRLPGRPGRRPLRPADRAGRPRVPAQRRRPARRHLRARDAQGPVPARPDGARRPAQRDARRGAAAPSRARSSPARSWSSTRASPGCPTSALRDRGRPGHHRPGHAG